MQVKVIKAFGYPADIAIRDRIRAGAKIPFEKRGMIEHSEGEIIEAPDDMIASWIKRGLVEQHDA